MLEILNNIKMIDEQLKSSFITEKERNALLNSKLAKWEKFEELKKEDIEATNFMLTLKLEEEYVDDL